VPHDPLARGEFGDPLGAAVQVLVGIGELGAEFVDGSVDVSGPPSANVVDGREGLIRRLVEIILVVRLIDPASHRGRLVSPPLIAGQNADQP